MRVLEQPQDVWEVQGAVQAVQEVWEAEEVMENELEEVLGPGGRLGPCQGLLEGLLEGQQELGDPSPPQDELLEAHQHHPQPQQAQESQGDRSRRGGRERFRGTEDQPLRPGKYLSSNTARSEMMARLVSGL